MPHWSESMSRERVPHLVVVGGGFAGLWATRALARERIRITLVDRRNHHLFQPLLYQVATAGLSAPDIAAPCATSSATSAMWKSASAKWWPSTSRPGRSAWPMAARWTTTACCWPPAPPRLLRQRSVGRRCARAEDAGRCHRTAPQAAAGVRACRGRAGPGQEGGVAEFRHRRRRPDRVELAGTLAEIARHTLRNEFRHIDPASACVWWRPAHACCPRSRKCCR